MFYNEGGPIDSTTNLNVNGCYFRIVGGAVPQYNSETGTLPTGQALVAFEIREGQYAVYPATATEVIGVPLTKADGTPRFAAASLMTAKAHCDGDRECVGMQTTDGTYWTVFGAAKREGVIGKIRVIGENIQSWVPLPTGL